MEKTLAGGLFGGTSGDALINQEVDRGSLLNSHIGENLENSLFGGILRFTYFISF
jgi:hypothetical protein